MTLNSQSGKINSKLSKESTVERKLIRLICVQIAKRIENFANTIRMIVSRALQYFFKFM